MQPDGGDNQNLQQPQSSGVGVPQPQNIPAPQADVETEPESNFEPVNWEA